MIQISKAFIPRSTLYLGDLVPSLLNENCLRHSIYKGKHSGVPEFAGSLNVSAI